MEITSTNNPKVKAWMKYHQKKYRDVDKRFLIEGEHLIEEAISADSLETLLIREGTPNPFNNAIETYILSNAVIDKLSKNISEVNYIGIAKQATILPNNMERIILLDAVQDPGNLGTIIRSAHSFGFNAIYISNDSVDVYNEKVIRSTQGALFHVPVKRVDLIETIHHLKKDHFKVYATALEGAKPLSDAPQESKVAIIFGNEGSGVSANALALSDAKIKIETLAFESLNVGVAASICMYYFRKRG